MNKDGCEICVQICVPGKAIFSMSVSPESPVSVLRQLLKGQACELIYSGKLLSDSLSFGFYGISDKDYVVALPARPGEDRKKHICDWSSITKDYDTFREKIGALSNPNTSHEFARLHDLRFFRMSDNPATFRRMCRSYRANSEYTDSGPKCSAESSPCLHTQSRDSLQSPSKEPLPVLWVSEEPEEAVA